MLWSTKSPKNFPHLTIIVASSTFRLLILPLTVHPGDKNNSLHDNFIALIPVARPAKGITIFGKQLVLNTINQQAIEKK